MPQELYLPREIWAKQYFCQYLKCVVETCLCELCCVLFSLCFSVNIPFKRIPTVSLQPEGQWYFSRCPSWSVEKGTSEEKGVIVDARQLMWWGCRGVLVLVQRMEA